MLLKWLSFCAVAGLSAQAFAVNHVGKLFGCKYCKEVSKLIEKFTVIEEHLQPHKNMHIKLNTSLSNKDAEIQGVVEDFINITINGLLEGLDDPLIIDCLYERYNNVILTGWLNMSELKLSGLRSVVASQIEVQYNIVSSSSINLTIEVGDLSVFFNYETSLLVGQLLPYFAKGNISANLDTLVLSLFTLADVSLIPTSITGFQNASVDFSVGKGSSFHVEGIYNSDSISKDVNEAFDILLPRLIDFLDVNQERIGKVISPVLQALLDSIFNRNSEVEEL